MTTNKKISVLNKDYKFLNHIFLSPHERKHADQFQTA